MKPMMGIVFVVCAGCVCIQGQTAAAVAALEGYDPVLLTEGKEVGGKEALQERYGRFLYQFSSEDTRAKFRKEPARYGIQLDGACARMGAPVGGSADSYAVHEGRIYIFGSSECYKQFVKDPAKYLQPKEASAWTPSANGAARARKALERATAGLSGVASYIEVRRSTANGREREETRIARMPDSFRSVTTDGQRQFGTLVDATGGLQIFNEEGRRMPPSFAQAARVEFSHDLVTLLLETQSPAAKLDIDGDHRVKVLTGGDETILELDPGTGRVAAMAYRRRGPEGKWGLVRITYSEYRDAGGGVQLPHHAEASFEGQSVPFGSWVVERYAMNPPDIEARLAAPAKIREK